MLYRSLYDSMCTRNNNFNNRGARGTIVVIDADGGEFPCVLCLGVVSSGPAAKNPSLIVRLSDLPEVASSFANPFTGVESYRDLCMPPLPLLPPPLAWPASTCGGSRSPWVPATTCALSCFSHPPLHGVPPIPVIVRC